MSLSHRAAIGSLCALGIGKWFGCNSRALAMAFGIVLLLLTAPKSAPGSVFVSGDVEPADNPFTAPDEGLPLNGNRVEEFEPVGEQTFFEGIHLDNDPDDFLDDENLNRDIYVGRRAFGVLLISGDSELRFMNLIIGDEEEVPSTGLVRKGTGVVRITGFGSLFNNDPDVFIPGLPSNFSSVNPRINEAGYNDGFDLYVGRFGTGTLDISLGARAEIHDAVIVGDQPGSIGTIIVDGFDSFLGSGGFEEVATGGGLQEDHQMTIGRLGVGFMTIRNGGRVLAEAIQGRNDDAIAATIGSRPFDENDVPELGGEGTVTVTGLNSQWIVGGTLQVGGFHEITSATPGMANAGEDVEYNSSAGRGTLNVAEGGVVALRFGIGADVEDDPLRLLIGRFGRVELNNGIITIGSGNVQGGGGDEGDARSDAIQLLNDGVIRGGGRISTGVFHNRFFGEVRVDAGQKLIIDSSTDVVTGTPGLEPLVNWGLMQVIGTPEARAELEFERAPSTSLEPIQPFVNSFVEDSPIDRTVGQITAAHATLRFRSGLSNFGKITFIAGDNFVSGPVVNEGGVADPPSPAGGIAIAGNNTTVTFEDTFTNNGDFEIFPNSSLAIFESDFNQGASGAMAITLGGRPTGSELSFLSVGGDANLAGTLEVNLFSAGANPIDPMPGDEYQILGALGDVNGIFTNLIMPNLGAGMTMFPVYDRVADTVTLVVGTLVGVMGADFNGDGVVNGLDLVIWQQNVGIDMGATGAQGDADGDGDVDGDDFLIWQQTLGPVPGSGSGSGAQQLGSNVPEPGSLALLLAAMLALAAHRRQTR
ncbi:MAG TPA: dockerin type I domain-containing protein [Lacipirellulaceae bacterium]